ncbi:MAG: redoxin domain-containing protein [Clostridiales bacterium]|nr:redoxin domain-containing protein [Clostridiales bacterium]
MKKKIIVFLTLIAILAALITTSLAAGTKSPVGVNISGFSTVDLYGNQVDSIILGKYELTIFNLWATWCSPCLNEMPHLQKLYENYEQQGVNVVGLLSEGNGSTPSSAKALCESKGYTYPTLRYVTDNTLKTLVSKSGGYIPVTYAVNSSGEVLEYYVGGMTYNQFVAFVERNLDEPTPTETPAPTESPKPTVKPTESPAPTNSPEPSESPDEFHTVRFLDWNDVVLKEEEVRTGESATAPSDPELEGHYFEKWDKAFDNVVADLDVYAKYRLCNDVNDDNVVNTGDAVLILRTVISSEFSDFDKMVADVNKDGNVNTGDAVMILKNTIE